MKGITIWQPWAEAISLADDFLLGDWSKRTENRDWCPPVNLIGQEIAIHAAKRDFDEDDAEVVGKMLFNQMPDQLRARLVRDSYTRGQWYAKLREGMGHILCVATLAGVASSPKELSEQQRRWWVGDYGWRLERVRALPRPVLCRGMQGLWDVPREELGQLRMQIPEGS